jgi:DNA-binding winged helix-turn-helix (wHTH) protein
VESTHATDRSFHFGVFDVNLQSEELRKQGLKIRLPHQSFQVLACLLNRPGEVVTRDEFRRSLWAGDTFVDFDLGLSSAVKKLRDALGDSAATPRFIETIPRRGYRFIYPVNGSAAAPLDRPIAREVAVRQPNRLGRAAAT